MKKKKVSSKKKGDKSVILLLSRVVTYIRCKVTSTLAENQAHRIIMNFWYGKENHCTLTKKCAFPHALGIDHYIWKLISLECDVTQLDASWLRLMMRRRDLFWPYPHESPVKCFKFFSCLGLHAIKGKFWTVFQSKFFMIQFTKSFVTAREETMKWIPTSVYIVHFLSFVLPNYTI